MSGKHPPRIRNLIASIAAAIGRPIEVSTVRDALIKMGIQDQIQLFPDPEMNSEHLRGVFYQYTRRDSVYGDPILVTLITYCSQLSIQWQRVICVKELIHVLDKDVEKTNLSDEIEGLINRIIGPFSTEDFNAYDIMALKDKMALYQSLSVLFPSKSRQDFLIKHGVNVELAMEIFCLPEWAVKLVLSSEWPKITQELDC
jgi:hypothetical protein